MIERFEDGRAPWLAGAIVVVLGLAMMLVPARADAAPVKVNPIKKIRAFKDRLSSKDDEVSIRDKWALIVSMDRFHDQSIEPIKFAQNNALFMSALLANPDIGRFGPKHVLTVTNTKAIHANISKCLKEPWLLKHALPDDLVLLYFCTRYQPVETELGADIQLFFYDTDKLAAEGKSIRLRETLKELRRRIQSPHIVCLLDISPISEGEKQLPPDFFEDVARDTKTTIFAASVPGRPSEISSINKCSFFMANLIEGFRAGGGQTDLGAICDFVSRTLSGQVSTILGREQKPVLAVAPENSNVLRIAPGVEVKSSKKEKVRIGHPISKMPEVLARRRLRQKLLAARQTPSSGANAMSARRPNSGANAMSARRPNSGANAMSGGFTEDPEIEVQDDVDFGPYMRKMKKDIQACWKPPRGFQQQNVVAVFSITRDGNIMNAEIVDGSGNEAVDASAMKALRVASPLDPLPKGAPPFVQIRYQFSWNVSPSTSSN